MNKRRGLSRIGVVAFCGAIALLWGCRGELRGLPSRSMPLSSGLPSARVMRVVSGQTIEVQYLDGRGANSDPLDAPAITHSSITSEPATHSPATHSPATHSSTPNPPPTTSSTTNQSIRLLGVAAPAWDQRPWGPEAQRYLEQTVLGQTVQLQVEGEEPDAYGRQRAYVWLGDRLVNHMLVQKGYVMATGRSPHPTYDTPLVHAQYRARSLGLGIWNPDAPLRTEPRRFHQLNP